MRQAKAQSQPVAPEERVSSAGSQRLRRAALLVVCVVCAFAMSVLGAAQASAAPPPVPAWELTVGNVPSALPAGLGRQGRAEIVVANIGGAGSEGGVVVRDLLPPGLRVLFVVGSECESLPGSGPREFECQLSEAIPSGGMAFLYVQYEETGALTPGSSLPNLASVSGGGAPPASQASTIHVKGEGQPGPGPAGLEHFAMNATGPAGENVFQAGGHPTFFTTSVLFDSMFREGEAEGVKPIEAVKDLVFYLPLGMLGDATVADECPASLVETSPNATGCPAGSRVGTVMPLILGEGAEVPHGIYDIEPEKGYAAEFAFASNNFIFVTYASVVRRDGKYMVRVSVPGIPTKSALIGLVATFFGDIHQPGETEGTFDRGAFLTEPSNCGATPEERSGTVAFDTWEHPATPFPVQGAPTEQPSVVFPPLIGCDAQTFSSALDVKPQTTQADEASGYEVGLEVPQSPKSFTGLGTPPVRDATVELPVGTTISPSSANGLEACAATGPEGIDIEGPESEEVGPDGLERPAAGHCPQASQIATVRATTPLLREELVGRIFLATPQCGQGESACTSADAEDGKLIPLYLEVEGPHSGIVVKLAGNAIVRQGTGQLVASFQEIPQFPFGRFTVVTKQGPRAPLENAQSCETQTSNATLTPWSPETPAAHPTSSFNVDWDGRGAACPGNPPFAPAFTAGTTSPVAATTSPFALLLRREDREQNIRTLSTTLPEGLLANLSKVARCPEPQASQASLSACPASSQIGTTTVAVGPGSEPYYVTGKVFFTGPYDGAPFGLSVVVPAVAGPFNLGDVLVRARLFVDPHTAQATAVSDPLPQELDGIPLRLRTLSLALTNEEFVLNPTGCVPMSITGTVTSPSGASAPITAPFLAKGCEKLAFKPAFSATTEAKATKANGTGLKLKLTYPSSGEANIAKVVLGFPKQMPVRLQTLQKACPAATFEANPAVCPAASTVGTAIVHTPILSQPLKGPIYLVSYGNAKFPDAVVVLQGEGLTIDVDGQSRVSHKGALTATFASVPDAPFSTFEATLPRGPHSQFTSVRTVGKAHGSQCGEKLVVPVTLVAHNGLRIKQRAKVKISDCPRSRQRTRGSKHRRTRRR